MISPRTKVWIPCSKTLAIRSAQARWRTDDHPAFNIGRHFAVIALEERYTSRFGAVRVIRDGKIIETGFFDRARISSGCLRMFGYALPERRKIRHCRSRTDIAIGKSTCALEYRVGVATHPNRNRTVGVGFWSQRHIVDLKKFSHEGHTVFLPKTAHELYRFKPARAAPLEWHSRGVIVGLSVANANSERQPASGYEIDCGQSFGQKHGTAIGQEQYASSELDLSRGSRRCGQRRQRLEVVVGQPVVDPQRMQSDLFGFSCELKKKLATRPAAPG